MRHHVCMFRALYVFWLIQTCFWLSETNFLLWWEMNIDVTLLSNPTTNWSISSIPHSFWNWRLIRISQFVNILALTHPSLAVDSGLPISSVIVEALPTISASSGRLKNVYWMHSYLYFDVWHASIFYSVQHYWERTPF
jgi:hypothetical protein